MDFQPTPAASIPDPLTAPGAANLAPWKPNPFKTVPRSGLITGGLSSGAAAAQPPAVPGAAAAGVPVVSTRPAAAANPAGVSMETTGVAGASTDKRWQKFLDQGINSAGELHPTRGVYVRGKFRGKTPGEAQELLRAQYDAGGASSNVSPAGSGLRTGGLGKGPVGTSDADWKAQFPSYDERVANEIRMTGRPGITSATPEERQAAAQDTMRSVGAKALRPNGQVGTVTDVAAEPTRPLTGASKVMRPDGGFDLVGRVKDANGNYQGGTVIGSTSGRPRAADVRPVINGQTLPSDQDTQAAAAADTAARSKALAPAFDSRNTASATSPKAPDEQTA